MSILKIKHFGIEGFKRWLGVGSLADPYIEIVTLSDGTTDLRLETDGSIRVAIQDQTSDIVDLYMHTTKETLTLSANQSIDDTAIVVTDVTGVSVGDLLCFKEDGRYTQVEILNIVSTTLTIDSPLDYAYTTDASVHTGEHDLKTIAGSLAAPIIYAVSPPTGTKWDIVRVLLHIEDQTAMDTSKFGGISALTNGVILRAKNGTYKNIFNVKTNGEFAERAYDVDYSDKAPAGFYGLTIRRTFGGQDKNGVVVRIDGNEGDEFQVMIQDDLTNLDHFHCIVQGHVVID